MQTDYSLFKRQRLSDVEALKSHETWDVFVSAYNDEVRVHQVFNNVQAHRKVYIGLPDYTIGQAAVPDSLIPLDGQTEAEIVEQIVANANLTPCLRICIDATGIVRHYLPALMKHLQMSGISEFDFLYSEPARYGDKEDTQFSSTELLEVRQVLGFEGSHSTDTTHDLLIIGAGYEHRLVSAVSDNKNHADKRVVYAFPSMRPDMYQESVLSTYISRESLGTNAVESPRFAPAYDPFVTAGTLHSIVTQIGGSAHGITNLYLAPVSSKPMTIGFALFYLQECQGTATSLILPFTKSYANRSAFGISRVWIYHIEFNDGK